MKFRGKILAALTALVLLMAGLSVAAAAGNHHGRGRVSTLCAVTSCHTVGTHTHGGRSYAGHTMGDGHSWHRQCTVRNCTQTGAHRHGNQTCLPRARSTGRCCR